MNKVGIINYGSGNYSSVWNAFKFLGADLVEVKQEAHFEKVSGIVLPGVGSFPACMQKLKDMHLIEPLSRYVLEKKIPFLGICVGMQILAERGHEFVLTPGLGWIRGEVSKIDVAKGRLKLPHIGWNECVFDPEWFLFKEIHVDPCFYFVNSFALKVSEKLKMAHTEYGTPFVSAIQKENIIGVQFHPEKSQKNGLKLLENFLKFDKS